MGGEPMGGEPAAERVLILCTANRCRSVMAAAFLARRLGSARWPAAVGSAGIAAAGQEPPPGVVSVLAGYGLDVTGHRAAQVTADGLRGAQLVVGMAREHLRHAVVTVPGCWPRTFTLKELVRRGAERRARAPGEPLAGWLATLHEGRDRGALLGDDLLDDVADPIGGPPRGYAATAAEVDHLVRELAWLAWGLPAGDLPRQ
jgi:protein-tyrosine phosphatase